MTPRERLRWVRRPPADGHSNGSRVAGRRSSWTASACSGGSRRGCDRFYQRRSSGLDTDETGAVPLDPTSGWRRLAVASPCEPPSPDARQEASWPMERYLLVTGGAGTGNPGFFANASLDRGERATRTGCAVGGRGARGRGADALIDGAVIALQSPV